MHEKNNKLKTAFLDRDGTINVDKNYLYKVEDFEFLPGVIDGLRLLRQADYQLIIVTNQSGIARGYYSEDDYLRLDRWMKDRLQAEGIEITASYYCPHLPDAAIKKYSCDCDCRKPKLAMFHQAIREHNIDVDQSIVIGDKPRDLALCYEYTQCQGFLLYSDTEEEKENIHKIKGGIYEVANRILG